MEKIKVKGSSSTRSGASRRSSSMCYRSSSQVRPPTKWNGDIALVHGRRHRVCNALTGWNTVYRDEGQTVYLSDDGSVYQTPDPDTGGQFLPPEPYVPTLAELQAAKKREISQACETAIYSGVDVNACGRIHRAFCADGA